MQERSNLLPLRSWIDTHGAYVLTGESESGPVVCYVDPAVAAALWEIGSKILVSAGVKALSKLLGLDGPRIDIETILLNLVGAIESVMRNVLDRRDIAVAVAHTEAVITLLSEYTRSPASSAHKLIAADIESIKAVKQLERLLPISAHAYSMSVMVRLSALQQLAINSQLTGDEANVQAFSTEAGSRLDNALNAMTAANDQRISGITEEYSDNQTFSPSATPSERERIPRRDATWVCYYQVDGVFRSFEDKNRMKARADAEQSRSMELSAMRRAFQAGIELTLLKTRESLSAISTWTIQRQ